MRQNDVLDDVLADPRVHGRNGVVEHQHGIIGNAIRRPGQRDALLLPARERDAALADLGPEAAGEDREVVAQVRRPDRAVEGLLVVLASEQDVLQNCAANDLWLLRRVGQRLHAPRLALGRRKVADDAREERGLATANGSHDCHSLTASHAQRAAENHGGCCRRGILLLLHGPSEPCLHDFGGPLAARRQKAPLLGVGQVQVLLDARERHEDHLQRGPALRQDDEREAQRHEDSDDREDVGRIQLHVQEHHADDGDGGADDGRHTPELDRDHQEPAQLLDVLQLHVAGLAQDVQVRLFPREELDGLGGLHDLLQDRQPVAGGLQALLRLQRGEGRDLLSDDQDEAHAQDAAKCRHTHSPEEHRDASADRRNPQGQETQSPGGLIRAHDVVPEETRDPPGLLAGRGAEALQAHQPAGEDDESRECFVATHGHYCARRPRLDHRNDEQSRPKESDASHVALQGLRQQQDAFAQDERPHEGVQHPVRHGNGTTPDERLVLRREETSREGGGSLKSAFLLL
mmetsp:Transcript_7721/g.28265  ORF Transcript_7721/g.28265 Transcript_7721/m.28265 type:complete len:517 (+) Transcript_7721:2213-3763(+)